MSLDPLQLIQYNTETTIFVKYIVPSGTLTRLLDGRFWYIAGSYPSSPCQIRRPLLTDSTMAAQIVFPVPKDEQNSQQ